MDLYEAHYKHLMKIYGLVCLCNIINDEILPKKKYEYQSIY